MSSRNHEPDEEEDGFDESVAHSRESVFNHDLSKLNTNLKGLQHKTADLQDQYGVPGITVGALQEEEEAYDPANLAAQGEVDLAVDPSLLRKTSGYLYKRASDSKKWKKRFFVLKHELKNRSEPFELYYFSKPSDTTPKAIIVLDGAEVVAESRNAKEKHVKNEFQVSFFVVFVL